MRYLSLLILLSSIGCTVITVNEEKLASKMHNEVKSANEQLVAIDCNNLKIPSHDFNDRFFEAKKCGLLYDNLIANEQLKKEICPALGIKGDECIKKVSMTFVARMVNRYPKASTQKVDSYCEMYPTECKDGRETEIKFLNMHNDNVQAEFMGNVSSLKEEDRKREEQASDDFRRRLSGALGTIGASFQNTPQSSYQPTPQPQYKPAVLETKSTQCLGVAPWSPNNCRMICINGEWSSVCN